MGKERLRPRRSYSGVMIVSPLLFGGEGTLASPAVPMLPMATPPVGASVVRSGWVGLHGRPWGGVGTRSPYIDKPNSPGDSQRTTIKAHILSVTCHPER